MKKSLVALAALITLSAAQAANFVQLEQENVQARQNGGADSNVTYLRAGKDLGNYSLGLQARTARFSTDTTSTSLETTVANKKVSVAGITPFVGVGHEFNGTAGGFNYGLVGATTGAKVGPGFAYTGLKTRVGVGAGEPKQTVGFVGYSVPVAKDISVNAGLSRSGQDIKERAVAVGVSFGF